MEDIPFELLESISARLELGSYIALRKTCKHTSRLDPIPSLRFNEYKEATNMLGTRLIGCLRIKLNVDQFNDEQMTYLFSHQHFVETIRCLHLKGYLTSVEARQNLFNRSTAYYSFNGAILSALLLHDARLFHDKSIDPSQLNQTRIDPSAQGNTAIVSASEKGSEEIVKLLLSHPKVDPTVKCNTSLMNAIKFGRLDNVKLLLADSRVNPTDQGNLAIIWASREGFPLIVQLLMNDVRVDSSAQENQALCWASDNGHIEIVNLLLKDKRVQASSFKEAVRCAKRKGHLSIVEALNSIKGF